MDWINKMVNKKINKMTLGAANKLELTGGAHKVATEKSQDDGESKEKKKAKIMTIFGPPPEDEHFDPFKRTGFPFGSLVKEIRYRYSKYLSDITDGLNLHCFIAMVFIFTVCFAPALCFGGILGNILNSSIRL